MGKMERHRAPFFVAQISSSDGVSPRPVTISLDAAPQSYLWQRIASVWRNFLPATSVQEIVRLLILASTISQKHGAQNTGTKHQFDRF